MEAMRKKFPNHTDVAYREAVSRLKYLLAESYAPRTAYPKPTGTTRRLAKDNAHADELAEDLEIQSLASELSKKEAPTRIKYYASRTGHYPLAHQITVTGNDRLSLPPAELSSFIERQEEYIEQLERESRYCKDELRSLVEKVKEVVSENEALQNKNRTSFFRTVLMEGGGVGGCGGGCGGGGGGGGGGVGEEEEEREQQQQHQQQPRSSRKSTGPRPLEGPSIVFESRISELEAQLTQARLELRKAREENQENLTRLAVRKDEPQLHLELERALRDKRELEAKGEELRLELDKCRARDTDVEYRSQRATEVVQQAEYEKAQAEAETRRLREELEKRQEKLREALQDTSRRLIEEKQLVERRFSQQMEQLSADVATHWEAASKSHLESEKQRRQIADLKRELAQKLLLIEDLKKELQTKTSKMQEELKEAMAERDASQEEASSVKLSAERCERQARQDQSRLQSEISSYKMRLERADADLVHARRENLRLAESIASLEKEINMTKIVEETRVGTQPPRYEMGKEEKDKDKDLASLIFDLESKQAKTVAGLEDALSKQGSEVSRLTAECQSLTRRLEYNHQNHKEKMANLQANVEYLSNKVKEYFDVRDPLPGESDRVLDTDFNPTETIQGYFQDNNNHNNNNNRNNDEDEEEEEVEEEEEDEEEEEEGQLNDGSNSLIRHNNVHNQSDNEDNNESTKEINNSSDCLAERGEEPNSNKIYAGQVNHRAGDHSNNLF